MSYYAPKPALVIFTAGDEYVAPLANNINFTSEGYFAPHPALVNFTAGGEYNAPLAGDVVFTQPAIDDGIVLSVREQYPIEISGSIDTAILVDCVGIQDISLEPLILPVNVSGDVDITVTSSTPDILLTDFPGYIAPQPALVNFYAESLYNAPLSNNVDFNTLDKELAVFTEVGGDVDTSVDSSINVTTSITVSGDCSTVITDNINVEAAIACEGTLETEVSANVTITTLDITEKISVRANLEITLSAEEMPDAALLSVASESSIILQSAAVLTGQKIGDNVVDLSVDDSIVITVLSPIPQKAPKHIQRVGVPFFKKLQNNSFFITEFSKGAQHVNVLSCPYKLHDKRNINTTILKWVLSNRHRQISIFLWGWYGKNLKVYVMPYQTKNALLKQYVVPYRHRHDKRNIIGVFTNQVGRDSISNLLNFKVTQKTSTIKNTLSHQSVWNSNVVNRGHAIFPWGLSDNKNIATVIVPESESPTIDDPRDTITIITPVKDTYTVETIISCETYPELLPINIASASVKMDVDSWGHDISLELMTASDAIALSDFKVFQLIINGTVFRGVVMDIKKNETFNGVRYNATCHSLATLLTSPFQDAKNYSQGSSALSIAQLVNQELPVGWSTIWDIDNNAHDALMPGYGYHYNQKTPLESMMFIANGIGATISCDIASQVLNISPRYPINTWNFWNAVPYCTLPRSIILSHDVSLTRSPLWEKVICVGTKVGVQVGVTKSGTSGGILKEVVSHDMIVSSSVASEVGRMSLCGRGKHRMHTVAMPLLDTPGILRPKMLVELETSEGTTFIGQIMSVSLGSNLTEQTVTIDEYYE